MGRVSVTPKEQERSLLGAVGSRGHLGLGVWTHMALYFPAEKRRVASKAHQQLLVFLPLGSFPHTFPRGPSLPFCWGGKTKAGGVGCDRTCIPAPD